MPAGAECQDGKAYSILCIVQANDLNGARFSDQVGRLPSKKRGERSTRFQRDAERRAQPLPARIL